MREDIKIDTETGGLVLRDVSEGTAAPLTWLGEPDDWLEDRLVKAVVEVPWDKDDWTIAGEGVRVSVPYLPADLPFVVKVRRTLPGGVWTPFRSPRIGNGDWFPVLLQDGSRATPASLELFRDGDFMLAPTLKNGMPTGSMEIRSAKRTDFVIGDANVQNGAFLVKCFPGQSYRYPATGVGLIRWLNGNMAGGEAAKTIKEQFALDGVAVDSADYDNGTGELRLKADYSRLD